MDETPLVFDKKWRCREVLLRLYGYPRIRDINPGTYVIWPCFISGEAEMLRLQMAAAHVILEQLGLWQD